MQASHTQAFVQLSYPEAVTGTATWHDIFLRVKEAKDFGQIHGQVNQAPVCGSPSKPDPTGSNGGPFQLNIPSVGNKKPSWSKVAEEATRS